MSTRAALALGIAASLSAALALGSPFAAELDPVGGFAGLPWGASVADLRAAFKGQALLCDGPRCTMPSKLGGVPVSLDYEFRDDRLVSGLVTFAAANYATIRDLLVDRFGPATASEDFPALGRSGATFAMAAVRWEGPVTVVVLHRYGEPVDRGIATFMSRDEARRRGGPTARPATLQPSR